MPSSAMAPPKRRVTPTIELISVVLPVPLRPNSASASPSASASEMSGSTTASPYPARRFWMRSRSGIGGLAEVHGFHLRVARHLLRRSLRQQSAIDQHGDAVGEREHQVHVM